MAVFQKYKLLDIKLSHKDPSKDISPWPERRLLTYCA